MPRAEVMRVADPNIGWRREEGSVFIGEFILLAHKVKLLMKILTELEKQVLCLHPWDTFSRPRKCFAPFALQLAGAQCIPDEEVTVIPCSQHSWNICRMKLSMCLESKRVCHVAKTIANNFAM